MHIFVCPKCGYGDIRELSLCVVIYRVTEWSDDGQPLAYDEGEVDRESDVPYDTLGGPLDREAKPTMLPLRRTIRKAKARRHSSKNT